MQTPPATKTPVSLLQELSMRRGISPKYDLLQIEGPAHEPTFVYRVTVGEFEASGSGQTKKRAKHVAAKEVLDIIIKGGSGVQTSPASTHADIPTDIFPSYDDGIAGNPIGSLQELCTSRRLPPPGYELVAEEGYPHEKTFAITCSIGQFHEVGTGKSKKLAKRQAADKMLQMLKNQPADASSTNVLADEDEEIEQKLSSRYSKESKQHGLLCTDSRKISLLHKSLKDEMGPNLRALQTTPFTIKDGVSLVELLHKIAKEVGFEVTYVEIGEKSISGQCQCLVQLSTAPVVVCYGCGPSFQDASVMCAYNALEYLKVMTKN